MVDNCDNLFIKSNKVDDGVLNEPANCSGNNESESTFILSVDHVSRVAEQSTADAQKDETRETVRDNDKREENYRNLDSYALHRRLSEVDPETAKRLHPRDRRKIIR